MNTNKIFESNLTIFHQKKTSGETCKLYQDKKFVAHSDSFIAKSCQIFYARIFLEV